MVKTLGRVVPAWGCVVLVAAATLSGCTKPNPVSCSDGSCTDPELPFCDVDGLLSGTPKTCIAVSCVANEFAGCRGDKAITCSVDGTNYDLLTCPRGCDPVANGCRACDPGETVCANGMVQTCDGGGTVVASQSCPLGCFEDEPRCRDIDPSNGLAPYLDMPGAVEDLDLSAGGAIEADTGSVTSFPNSTMVPVRSYLMPAPANGVPVRVFVARRVLLGNVTVYQSTQTAGPAIAIVATDEIIVSGNVTLDGVGSYDAPSCRGGAGLEQQKAGTPVKHLTTGSGGGANATAGARGGGIDTQNAGGTGGSPSGVRALVPLRGGCPAGGVDAGDGTAYPVVIGGGSIQLASRVAITVNGTIDARGGPGFPEQGGTSFFIYGGGGGGGILLEAPAVSLGSSGQLLASGGSGGSLCSTPSTYCGAGGAGATVNNAAVAGGDSFYAASGVGQFAGGGGGGGLGRIRVNTPTATYTKASSSVEDGDISTGTVGTR